MLCIVELAMLAGGITLLLSGQLSLGKRVSRGAGARVAGALLMLPLPLSFGIGMIYGIKMAAEGQPMNRMDMAWKFAPIEIGIMLTFGLAALITLLATARVPERRRDYDEDDDYPRRRRRYEEDEYDDEDRPRRRRRRDEGDDEDDRPRRRRRYDDDDPDRERIRPRE